MHQKAASLLAYANFIFIILLLLAYVNNKNHFLLPVLLSTNIVSMYKGKYVPLVHLSLIHIFSGKWHSTTAQTIRRCNI